MRVLGREVGGLSGALFAHGALALWLARAALPAAAHLEEQAPVDVELETPPPPPEPLPSPSPTEPPPPAASPLALAHAPVAPPMPGEAPPPEAAPLAPAPSSSTQPFVFSPTAPSLSSEALGMSGRNPFIGNVPLVPGESSAPPSEPGPEANVAPGIQKSMHDALAAHDHELGLDTGGPLIGPLKDEVRTSDTPENTSAVFEVTINANGDVTGVRVLDASQARPAWDRVASHLAQTLRSRRIPLRAQGKGLVVTLEVQSRFVLPSGASGGPDPKIDLDGTNAGAHIGFDVSDIGARPKRDVHARILNERAL